MYVIEDRKVILASELAERLSAAGPIGLKLYEKREKFETLERAQAVLESELLADVRAARERLSDLEQLLYPESPTSTKKVEVYEHLLHIIQLNAEVLLNHEKTKKLIGNICSWSYAHRAGNGEPTEAEQRSIVSHAFNKLLDL